MKKRKQRGFGEHTVNYLRITDTTQTSLAACLKCGHKLSAVSTDDPDRPLPRPGDITLCLYCGHVHCLTEGLGLREPTIGELEELKADDPATWQKIVGMQDKFENAVAVAVFFPKKGPPQ